jgi:hypothetical protein
MVGNASGRVTLDPVPTVPTVRVIWDAPADSRAPVVEAAECFPGRVLSGESSAAVQAWLPPRLWIIKYVLTSTSCWF